MPLRHTAEYTVVHFLHWSAVKLEKLEAILEGILPAQQGTLIFAAVLDIVSNCALEIMSFCVQYASCVLVYRAVGYALDPQYAFEQYQSKN